MIYKEGERHMICELRGAETWDEERKLRGYLTLSREEFRYLQGKLTDTKRIRFTAGRSYSTKEATGPKPRVAREK